ncbi:hypothetical protein ACO0K7_15990 [Undibacterium sp. Ji67W]
MTELNISEVEVVSGGFAWVGAFVMGVFIYDAATDFYKGFSDAYK